MGLRTGLKDRFPSSDRKHAILSHKYAHIEHGHGPTHKYYTLVSVLTSVCDHVYSYNIALTKYRSGAMRVEGGGGVGTWFKNIFLLQFIYFHHMCTP